MDNLKRYNFKDDHGHPLENCQDYIDLLKRIETAESSLAAMRQRAEEAERRADLMEMGQMMAKVSSKEAEDARDAAIARAERAEACLRHLYDLHARGVFNLPDEHYAAITNAAEVLSSPPADASTMGGEREQRLADSLDEILNYSGGADNALEDEYVMERAIAALADMEKKA